MNAMEERLQRQTIESFVKVATTLYCASGVKEECAMYSAGTGHCGAINLKCEMKWWAEEHEGESGMGQVDSLQIC